MGNLVIAAIILMIIMLLFVFMLFRNIIRKINDNAKRYFVNKMQNYDYILEKKQADLEKLNEEIARIKLANQNILKKEEIELKVKEVQKNHDELMKKDADLVKYDLNVPDYREMQFFNNYKELKRLFSNDNENIINEFIEEHKNIKEEKEYNNLKRIRRKFNDEAIYDCMTLDKEKQIDTIKEVLTLAEKKVLKFDDMVQKDNFNINVLIKYIDERLEQIEPTIYIYVNGKENYDHINENIRTMHYNNMAEGIIIKYRNKIYDYSI